MKNLARVSIAFVLCMPAFKNGLSQETIGILGKLYEARVPSLSINPSMASTFGSRRRIARVTNIYWNSLNSDHFRHKLSILRVYWLLWGRNMNLAMSSFEKGGKNSRPEF